MEESTFKFSSLCQYRDVLGKPNKGIHKFRLFDVAIIDVLLTIVLGLLVARIFAITKFNGILLSFLLGLIFHKIFCVQTKVSKLLNDKFNFL